MPQPDPDQKTRTLAESSLASGDPTGWFERLYAAAEDGEAVVPWDRGAPHRLLVDWMERRHPQGHGKRAVVIGSGLGEDAEYVASHGFTTVAFDIAPTAVDAARRRFPGSPVQYVVADLLDLPVRWREAFDLVIEIFTVQALPPGYRRQATHNAGTLVAPGGTLVVIAAARDANDKDVAGPPWPLTRREIDAFAGYGIEPVRIENVPLPDAPDIRRWRAEFRRNPRSTTTTTTTA